VAAHLRDNLADPAGPPPGQPQYRPWYRRDPGISEYRFCVSSSLGVQENHDALRLEIARFFEHLSSDPPHLAHLKNLEVAIWDWSAFETRLQSWRTLAFRWFPKALLAGFAPLDDFRPEGRFRAYLSPHKLPYYSRAHHHRLVTEEQLIDNTARALRHCMMPSMPGTFASVKTKSPYAGFFAG